MLRQPMVFLAPEYITQIHATVVRLLVIVGVDFPHDGALAIFGQHGFRTDGQRVRITEDQLMKTLVCLSLILANKKVLIIILQLMFITNEFLSKYSRIKSLYLAPVLPGFWI